MIISHNTYILIIFIFSFYTILGLKGFQILFGILNNIMILKKSLEQRIIYPTKIATDIPPTV